MSSRTASHCVSPVMARPSSSERYRPSRGSRDVVARVCLVTVPRLITSAPNRDVREAGTDALTLSYHRVRVGNEVVDLVGDGRPHQS